ncbi:MAG TPA: hypothetical protein VMT18_03810 [Planctomycetota bacterium]|nr:hypothetical protein [Planctomycetota bacterium]
MLNLKTVLLLALIPAAGVSVAHLLGHPGTCGAALPGVYVEARSASVFAGACHYNGERETQGRELVAGWRLSAASTGRAELDGVELVVAVVADRNLDDAAAARKSVLYLPEELDDARAAAAEFWLRESHPELLGELVAVHRADVSVERDGDAFRVRAGDDVSFAGAALPDRACCSMPSQVWYEPEVAVGGRLVGHVERFRLVEPALSTNLERHDENSAFLGCLQVPSTRCAVLQPAALP